MQWQNIIRLARELATNQPSDHLHQTRLRIAVGNAYYAVYHALARSNADLLMGSSQRERAAPEWSLVYTALGGDSAFEPMQADFVFLAAHHQRLLAEEDPAANFTADQARDWIDRAEMAVSEFLSMEPEQRRAFAVQLLLDRSSGGMTDTGEAAVRP